MSWLERRVAHTKHPDLMICDTPTVVFLLVVERTLVDIHNPSWTSQPNALVEHFSGAHFTQKVVTVDDCSSAQLKVLRCLIDRVFSSPANHYMEPLTQLQVWLGKKRSLTMDIVALHWCRVHLQQLPSFASLRIPKRISDIHARKLRGADPSKIPQLPRRHPKCSLITESITLLLTSWTVWWKRYYTSRTLGL